jgi:hypothetical protein
LGVSQYRPNHPNLPKRKLESPFQRLVNPDSQQALERDEEKCAAVFRPIARQNKDLERDVDSTKIHPALGPVENRDSQDVGKVIQASFWGGLDDSDGID